MKPIACFTCLLFFLAVPALFAAPSPRGPVAFVREVTITRILLNVDSVRITFAPVKGAADYRVYEVSNPDRVKYAGLIHRQDPANPGRFLTQPATEIEWNGLLPERPTALIVEAVDQVGPVSAGSLVSERSMSHSAEMSPENGGYMTVMVGSNAGSTADGKYSINGQGKPGNRPNVLARSKSFKVIAAESVPLPSGKEATQVVFDTFISGEFTRALVPSVGTSVRELPGSRAYLLRTPQAEWDVLFQGADLRQSQPFVMDRHFMDLLFDGATGASPHKGRSACALSPRQTVDFSEGKILHLTMEVDGHLDGHRWLGFNLSPADDPLRDVYWARRAHKVNRANQSFFCEVTDSKIRFGVIDSSDIKRPDRLPGPIQSQGDVRDGEQYPRLPGNGRGLDNRVRFDLFLTQDAYVLFEDGKVCADGRIAGRIPFSRAKVYYSHFLYHSADEKFALESHAPHERYWIETFPYSDERHWDNIGYEVLPAETEWKKLVLHTR